MDEIITLDNSNNLFEGTNAPDFINGGLGDDTLRGFGGNDTLSGGSNNNLVFGGGGDDTLVADNFIPIGSGEGQLFGEAGNDLLIGGNVNDTLTGGSGDDTLAGGLGINRATGGAGADIYRFTSDAFNALEPGQTIITDFDVNQDSISSVIAGDEFSDLRFSGNNILGASTNKVVFTLEGVNTSDLTEDNFLGFQGSFADIRE